MPNPKALVILYITLVAALATAQTLPITAEVKPYGAPPYSPRVPGNIFNLYEWVVINGTVTPQTDFYGNITINVLDTITNLVVASCQAKNIGLSGSVTYSLYELLKGDKCKLSSHVSGVKTWSDRLALNFTEPSLIGRNRYIIQVTFRSARGNATFYARFSVSNEINMAVKAFGARIINDGDRYFHNKKYAFRLVVNVTHPDGRLYFNTSITVDVTKPGGQSERMISRYWANASDSNYIANINFARWEFTIPGDKLENVGLYRIVVNVSNIRVGVDGAGQRVRDIVDIKNEGRLGFTLNVTNKLKVDFINVTAVWPDYDSTPPSRKGTPTRVSYTRPDAFNASKWTLGDAFLLYVMVRLANDTTLSPSSLKVKDFRDYADPLIHGVKNSTDDRGGYLVVAVTATLKESEWGSNYRPAHRGVRVNATLKVEDDNGNTGMLPLRFVVTNTTRKITPRIFFNASKKPVENGSRVNLGDVLALELTVETHGGRTLNFTKGFRIRVYHVTESGLKDYTSLFDIRHKDNIIYLVVKPSRDLWYITKDNWRDFMNKTYLAVSVTERGMTDYMNLTLWWPRYHGSGRHESYNISVTARLPYVNLTFVNRTTVDYGQGVKLSITFRTHGGNVTRAKNLTLYVYKIDTQRRPLGWMNVTNEIVTRNIPYKPTPSAGNFTFEFNVNGKYPWIPGVWYINATVGDIFGNAGDFNNTLLFTIQPKIAHDLPKSLRVVAGKMALISSSLRWGNSTSIGAAAKLNITIVYPTLDGRFNNTLQLYNRVGDFNVPIPAPNVPGSYRVVVNFEYMTFGKKLYDRWVINFTVYMSVNATIRDMRSDPSKVAVAVGRSVPRGPVRGALVEDNLAAAALASVIGTNNVFFDDELLDPDTLAYKTAAGPYKYFIAVGGPLVNLFSYKYNATLSSIVQTYKEVVAGEVVEVGFKIMVPGDITRVYLNLTDNKYRIVYANGTVKVAGDYGKTDFAFVATVYDASVGRYIFISFGLDWRGTVAAGRWIAANINDLDRLACGQLVLLQWRDVNNDGSIQPNEVQRILPEDSEC